MKYLVTADEMKTYDANTIARTGIPGMVLMERAALAAFDMIQKRFGGLSARDRHVLIAVGTGNNGGDGLALARLLAESGYDVEVWSAVPPESQTGVSAQWKEQMQILTHYPAEIVGKPQRGEYTIIVDAIFGVGLSREVTGDYARMVAVCNELAGFKLALDVPSGVHSDTGEVLGCAFRADVTVTFGFAKRGLVLYPGCEYAGELVRADVGITEAGFYGRQPEMFYYDEEPSALLPKRNPSGNKGTFGKVLLIAGDYNMAGAAILSARAAYRAGAGMVRVLTPRENREILQCAVPEALLGVWEDWEAGAHWADMIGIGPGLGKGAAAKEALAQVIRHTDKPLLLDADALNLLAEDTALKETLAAQGAGGRSVILTPHVGELSRLTKVAVPELKKDLARHGKKLAEALHSVVVAKDARTIVCAEQGPFCVNIRGNSGMATAGSGDVLAGLICGLAAQGMEAFAAASVGVYFHACAGEAASCEKGEYGCMAQDIVEAAAQICRNADG
ncbi:MAG: NAD(P)H-hydrate dehydratase [Candidatus Gastranaerophilales bacterium]|nr:NAD(P)H-hydrate dehydratase [Candidatus Gastranaerophilales bacterium]